MELVPLGDSALLIQLGEAIGEETHARVRAVVAELERARLDGVVELVPAFTSVAVYYDPVRAAERGAAVYERLRRAIGAALARVRVEALVPGPLVEIPVCYGGTFGPDLQALAERAGLSAEAFAAEHAAQGYGVSMIGFAPGFMYLGGLPERLHAARHSTPRALVPAGSVGIAGAQTGIYPSDSPGGWQLIGRTPRRLFNPDAAQPTLVRLGDRVRFRAISEQEFAAWEEPPWQ